MKRAKLSNIKINLPSRTRSNTLANVLELCQNNTRTVEQSYIANLESLLQSRTDRFQREKETLLEENRRLHASIKYKDNEMMKMSRIVDVAKTPSKLTGKAKGFITDVDSVTVNDMENDDVIYALKQIHTDNKLLNKNIEQSVIKLAQIVDEKIPGKDSLQDRIKELEQENRALLNNNRNNPTQYNNSDEVKLLKATIRDKDVLISEQKALISQYKEEIEEIKRQQLDSNLFAPDVSMAQKPIEKSFIAKSTRISPQKTQKKSGIKVSLKNLFGEKQVEKMLEIKKANETAKIENTKKQSKKTVEELSESTIAKSQKKTAKKKLPTEKKSAKLPSEKKPAKKQTTDKKQPDTEKVKSIISKENRSYFQDLSFGNSSPFLDKLYKGKK